MSKREINDRIAGGLLLLLLFLSLHLFKGIFSLLEPDIHPRGDKVFVEILGDIPHPGVYGFSHPPSLEDLSIRAGRLLATPRNGLSSAHILYHSGAHVEMSHHGKKVQIFEDEMSAFYKITLGIPISINNEPLEGLTAVPGIGPTIAGTIVRERTKRGGFERLDELLSIQGIGPALYRKLTPHLVL